MATFTGSIGIDVADATIPLITGFTGGTTGELADGIGDTFLGGLAGDLVVAGSGSDTLQGGDGNDTLRGGLGDDRFVYTSGSEIASDVIDGGSSTSGDTIVVNYSGSADFSGASIASSGTTSIEALILVGAGGHDVIFNASQVDVSGLSSTLTIQGDTGLDIIRFAAASSLTLSALQLAPGWGTGGDIIVVEGTAGGDSIVGSAGRDLITTGAGNDLIIAGPGSDTMRGQGDNDVISYAFANDIESDVIDGGAQGTGSGDTLQITFYGVADFRSATFESLGATSIETLDMFGAGGHEAHFNASQLNSTGLSTSLTFLGDSGDDVVMFHAADSFNGTSFQFSLWGIGADRIIIEGTEISNTLFGTSAADLIIGGAGDDGLLGFDGNDTLSGDQGNDTIQYTGASQVGSDRIDGGDDVGGTGDILSIVVSGDIDFRSATLQSLGTTSIETLVNSGISSTFLFNGAQVSAFGLSPSLRISGATGYTDIVSFDNATGLDISGFTFVAWEDATDYLIENGTGANDTLTGSSQRDSMSGGVGNDTLRGGAGNDTIDGGANSDVADLSDATSQIALILDASGGAVATAAGSGTDTLIGIEGVTGGSANDVFIGNAAANVFDGGSGDDTMAGGDGDDTYLVDSALDRVNEAADEGFDTVLASASFDLSVQTFAHVEQLQLISAAAIGGQGNALDNFIGGSEVGNGLAGGLGNDTLAGFEGNDALDGQGGIDSMYGGEGADTYFVDVAGDEVVEGDIPGEFDTIWTLITLTLPANVEILILNGALALNGTGNDGPSDNTPNLMLGNNAANVLTTFGGDDIILGRDGNDTITTGAGSAAGVEIISGGVGNDTLTSGGGHDFFTYENINEAGDTITDFGVAGNDLDILDLRPMFFPTFTNLGGVTNVTQAVASGHLTFTQSGVNTQVFADANGGGNNNVLLATLNNTTAATVQILTLI